MRKLNYIEWIAVATALLVVSLFVFPNWFSGIFPTVSSVPVSNQAATPAANSQVMKNISTTPGLEIYDASVGNGEVVGSGATVTLNYIGRLTDGTVFDASSSHGAPFTFKVGAGQVIQGFDQGLVGMKVGGQRRIVISPNLGYGSNQAGPIPPNSTLVFDIELLSVK